MIKEKPHQSALRKERISQPGWTYFITTNVHPTHKQFGARPLLNPGAAEVIINAIDWLRDNGRIWRLGYVVMDDHLHLLMMLRAPYRLDQVMHSLKRYTAREINKLLGRTGSLWQPAYHDHAIRDGEDFWEHLHYMHDNPVRRGLAERPEDYIYSTAHPHRQEDIDWDMIGWSRP